MKQQKFLLAVVTFYLFGLMTGLGLADDDYTNIEVYPPGDTTQTETSIAVNPKDPSNILIGVNTIYKPDISKFWQGSYYSTNGGQFWGGGNQLPQSYKGGDPVVGFDTQGEAYFNYFVEGGEDVDTLFIKKSTDAGKNWQDRDTVRIAFLDKNWMAIDTYCNSSYKDYIYIAWTEGGIKFRRSTDGGDTFIDLQTISKGGFVTEHGVNLAVGPNGNLYGAWTLHDILANEDSLCFNKSTDGGGNFGTAKTILNIDVIDNEVLYKCETSFRVNSFPSLAVDRNNGSKIYMVWADDRYGDPDILLSKSTNGGTSWTTTPVRVNNDQQGNGIDQWFPSVCVDENGGVCVVFYDSRCDPQNNDLTELFLAYSTNAGQTFENVVISDITFCPDRIAASFAYMGDYIGVASVEDSIYAAWMDNRTGIYQAYFAKIITKSGTLSQNETWSGNVLVTGDVTIPSGKKLTIDDGTVVKFTTGKKLTVNGTLMAEGTYSNRITFTSSQPDPNRGDWYGIKFNDSSVDASCRIKYADIKFATFGIYLYKASPKITYTFVDSCSVSGIYLYQSTPKIEYCDFKHNGSMGTWCAYSYSYDYTIDWKGNDFDDNDGYGMYFENSSPTIKENSICNNSSIGIYTYGSNAKPFFSHSLIKYNGSDGVRSVSSSQPRFHYYPVGIGGCCEIIGNGGRGVYALSYSIPFLGISPSYSGNNSIYNNMNYEVDNSSSSTIYAEDNWWGSASGPGTGEIHGTVDYTPWLDQIPGCWQQMAGGENFYPEYSETPEYYSRLGTVYMLEKRYDEALELFRYVISNFPDDAWGKYSLQQLIFCYEMTAKEWEIVPFLEGVASMHDRQDLGLFALAQSIPYLEKGGEPEEALNRCWSLMGQFKDEQMRKDLLFQMGNIYLYGLEDESGAEDVFRQFIETYPDDDLAVIAKAKLALIGSATPLPKFAHSQEETPQIPRDFSLSQNYPNPFNPETNIDYHLSQKSRVTIQVFNVLGQQVKALVDGQKEAGYYTATWNARDEYGRDVASGVYFYRLIAGDFTQIKKMVLLR